MSNSFDPIKLIENLIKIESISGNELKLIEYLASYLRSVTDCNIKIDGRNIILVSQSDCYENNKDVQPSLLLCSHIDTVEVCNGWTVDPFAASRINEKIIGLGANDALASVVSILSAFVQANQELKSGKLKGRIIAAIVCEEEKGDQGFVRIEPSLPKYDYAIFGEPTNLQIGNCMRGSMKLKAFTRGKSCHASRPHEGLNAIFELTTLLEKLKNLDLKDDSPWGTATCEPVKIQGGSSENQIPDLVAVTIDSRPTWKKDNDTILKMLKDEEIEFEILRNIRKAQVCQIDSPLIHAIQKALPNTSLYPFGGSCDMAFTKSPSVIFGPGSSERSHSADEYILVSELLDGCDAYHKIISNLLTQA